jgi:hypothetical protein
MNANAQGSAAQPAGPQPAIPTGFIDLVDGKFAETNRADLARFFASLGTTDKLVVHFHGGLVSRQAAHDTAAILEPVFRAGGGASLFVVWNTDLETTLTDNLGKIAAEAIFWTIVQRIKELLHWKLTIAAAGVAGARAAARRAPIQLAASVSPARLRQAAAAERPAPVRIAPLTYDEANQIQRQLLRDRLLQQRILEILPRQTGARGARTGGKPTRMSPNLYRQLAPKGPGKARAAPAAAFLIKIILKVLRAVISRCRKGTDHQLYTTIVEEVLRAVYLANLGRAVWTAMKDNAPNAFRPGAQVHGGTALIEELGAWLKPGRRLTLTGHSAGSIFILELLEHAAKQQLALGANVVLMAPACTFERFTTAIPSIRATVNAMRLYSMCDEREHGYWEVRHIYNASLLYLISGILEAKSDTPILGMQRFYSGTGPYKVPELLEVDHFFTNELVWAPSLIAPQRETDGKTHGGFDEELLMKASLQDIVAQGLVG